MIIIFFSFPTHTTTGTGKSDHDAGTVRANYPINPSCGIFYYEIKVLDKGRDGYVKIEVAEKALGWKGDRSVGSCGLSSFIMK